MAGNRSQRAKGKSPEGLRPDGEQPSSLRAELSQTRQELATLYASLDNVQSGLLLLDRDLRACYSNPVLHTMFKAFSAERIRREKPYYADMLQEAAGADAVDVSDYVARRLEWVRSGDPTPMDLPMTNGTVLRCQLAILPGGGRMLTYGDVTDIVRNAQEMERLASIDGMTGIFNRRHFMTLAEREWERARRYRRPLSFLMIDIDNFKLINDRFGHEAGDAVILHVTNLACARKRSLDVLGRVGGDEFALLLPATDLGAAQAQADRLRHQIAEGACSIIEHRVTVSVGVGSVGETVSALSALMKSADQALYAAKRNGRNRVMCSLAPSQAPTL